MFTTNARLRTDTLVLKLNRITTADTAVSAPLEAIHLLVAVLLNLFRSQTLYRICYCCFYCLESLLLAKQ